VSRATVYRVFCAGSCAGRTIEQLELATAEWVGWYNHRRLHRHCGDIPPVELEAAYYAQHRAQRTA
jgi:putative transposase